MPVWLQTREQLLAVAFKITTWSNVMEDRCFLCRKRLKFGEDCTSINKGTHSPSGDKDWIALIFHEACWAKFGERR